ncbi:MAG: MarR family transcriptional regulator [Spongiibacteraceae bacterium]|jgi:DNA-binding MarR family transcriptional regulator|nr:MarR family transcriptional regulator [Spongiibacteraceae bacterium]
MPAIEEVLTALRRVIRATDLHSKHLEKTVGLTAPQLLLLQILRDRGDLTSGELARRMNLSQATVTTILDRLERRELVQRIRSETDKRKVYTALTEAGEAILREAPLPLQQHFVRRFQDLHDWEQAMILSSLQRVAHMMDADHLDASPVLDVGALDRSPDQVAGAERSRRPRSRSDSAEPPAPAD